MLINRKGVYFAGILAVLHLLFVASVYYAVIYENNTYATYGWVLLVFIDYPLSLGMGIESLQIKGNYHWNNGTLPGLYFGILGSIWWFILGYAFACLIGKIKSQVAKYRS